MFRWYLDVRGGGLHAYRPVFVICESGMRSLRSNQFLRQMGYGHVTNVRGGTAAWRNSGQRVVTEEVPRSAVVTVPEGAPEAER
jgi:rhodanese-related sulfurtransferase